MRGIAGVVPSIPRTQECRPGTGLRGLRELRGVCPYSFLRGVARTPLGVKTRQLGGLMDRYTLAGVDSES